MEPEDKKRFEEMYRRYEGVLRKIANTKDIPPDYIDDVVQDTFVAYARYGYSLDLAPETMKILLTKILKSRCMDYYRRNKYRHSGELEEKDFRESNVPASMRPLNVSEFVISKERCRAILEEIDRMPENWREVAVLKLIEGRPTQEVCQILNITEKACYSRVSRIRKHLEDLLNNDKWP